MGRLRSRIHVGIVHPMAFPETMRGTGAVVETLSQIAADEFFGAVEVRPAATDEIRAGMASVIRQSGIVPIISGQPPLLAGKHDLNSPGEEARAAAVACVRASVDEAVALGAPYVAILSGPDPGDGDRAAATERLVQSLCEICDYAVGASQTATPIHISLEAFDRDVEKRCLVGPTLLAVEVLDRVKASGRTNIGLLIDLSHLPLLGETAQECLALAAPHLTHAHAGNAFLQTPGDPAYGDQHPRFGYPGSMNGVRELADFLRVLGEVGYYDKVLPTGKPVVTFEVKPVPGESSELVIAGTKRAFLEACAML